LRLNSGRHWLKPDVPRRLQGRSGTGKSVRSGEAIDRVADDEESEIAELRAETEQYEQWVQEMDDLKDRLG
jgi:hypothetical protein